MKSLIISALLCAAIAAGASIARADDGSAALLDALFAARAATIAQMTSGEGTAIVKTSSHFDNGNPVQLQNDFVAFRFKPGLSFSESFTNDTPDKRKRLSAGLVRQGRELRYNVGGSSLISLTFEPTGHRSSYTIGPAQWTYREFCRIPAIPGVDDADFLRKAKGAQLSKDGNLITFTYASDVPQAKFHEDWSIVFDMTLGGMATKFSNKYHSGNGGDGKELNYVLSVEQSWSRRDGIVVPVKFTGRSDVLDNADPSKILPGLTNKMELEFLTFDAREHPDSDFDRAALKVKAGSAVQDMINGRTFAYSPDDPDSLYFGAGAATAPTTQSSAAIGH
jgi:hypothetical protein